MDDSPHILVIVPTYGAFEYARKTLTSLFAHSGPNTHAIVVDDGSPAWNNDWYQDVGGTVGVCHCLENGGLTKALNVGFGLAYGLNCDYIAAVNSDIIFTAGWWQPLVYNLQHGYDLVGPVSNAPGVSSRGVQDVKRWACGVGTSDTATSLKAVPKILKATYSNRVEPCDINGFFLMSRRTAWIAHAYEYRQFTFPPSIDIMPSGRANPTPLMTGQEDWLNHRVKRAGGRVGACLGSYIFHYRSVTRGVRHAVGDWHRMKEPPARVEGEKVEL